MFDGFVRREIDTGAARIACVVGGDGPPLLLLHGFPQTRAMWAQVAPALATRRTVVCADLRGYGDSTAPAGAEHSFRAMADDMAAVMRALGHEVFDLVGHDRGARTAHRLALDHPERVRSLAVLDILPTYDLLELMDRRLAEAYWHWGFLSLPEPFPERLIGADPEYFFSTFLALLGGLELEGIDPEMLADYRRCWVRPEVIHAMCEDYRSALGVDQEHDVASLGERVACPTLALWGESGVMGRLYDVGQVWARRCTDLRTGTIPGGHFFIDQNPEATRAALEGFLDTVA
jgi:haloacetate dehalogenase